MRYQLAVSDLSDKPKGGQKESERRRYERSRDEGVRAGELSTGDRAIPPLPAIERNRPDPLTPQQRWLMDGWQQLSQGRPLGAMGEPGPISWESIQLWLDREGEEGRWERKQATSALYAMDNAYRAAVMKKSAKRNNG